VKDKRVPAMQRKEQLMNNAGKNMYEKLTIRDKFMFGKVTKNPVIAQKMADLSEVPEGIREFLSYIENEDAEDDFTKLLDKEVKNARLNEEWRSEYLKTYVNDMDMRREGYVEGEKRGRVEGEKLGADAAQKKLLKNLMESQKITETEARKMLGI